MQTPWTPQYKLRPEDKSRLTAADVVGPDGVVYPDWRLAGVQGGIPRVPVAAKLEDFGGRPNAGDISDPLLSAVQAVREKGGGAILLRAGTYFLDRPVTIRSDNIVLRGQGSDKTKIIFRYAIPGGIAFYSPPRGARVGPATRIELHANPISPTNLAKMTISAGGRVIGTWAPSRHSGNTFFFSVRGRHIGALEGPCTIQGAAEYKDGSVRTTTLDVTWDPDYRTDPTQATSQAAICFQGAELDEPQIKLTRDGRRGDTRLELGTPHGLERGDRFIIEAPATKRWNELTRNARPGGTFRRYALQVRAVSGATIDLNQPLRIDYPIIDGAYVQKIAPVQHCGIEDLSIEQTENLWITSVLFDHAWNCWARGIKVHRCGRHAVYTLNAKWCEIRNCVFDEAWFKGGGGTAYGGWESSYDCLMENIETFNLRHAPLVQWSSSGCVIRKGVFHNSDAQWHAGWTSENLFEQCTVTSAFGNGGYGYGMWASPPGDTAHGPNGPRNVVYNCDVASPKAGVWLGGMNENWLFLHNRFVVEDGPGIYARTASFDHLIRGNVFILKSTNAPMIQLETADCPGIEILTNRLFGGNGQLAAGASVPLRLDGNSVNNLANAPRPNPSVPSIFEWQKANRLPLQKTLIKN